MPISQISDHFCKTQFPADLKTVLETKIMIKITQKGGLERQKEDV